jgi:hypothetical protein
MAPAAVRHPGKEVLSMKYVLMFCETEDWDKAWQAMDQAERDRGFAQVSAWLDRYADKILHSRKLTDAHTATTVRLEGGEPIVTDGPFVEGKEVVSGYVEVEVADLDEALAMARIWPGCPLVEIRPVLM